MTPDDVAVLRVHAGTHFRPGAALILPSGLRLEADEATALAAAYMPDKGLPDRQPPPHMAENPVTVSLADLANFYAERDQLRVCVKELRAYGREMRMVACYFAVLAVLAVGLLLWTLYNRTT